MLLYIGLSISRFVSQLNRSFGTGGGFTCSLSDQELSCFFQWVKRSQSTNIAIKKAVTVVGLQANLREWVMSENCYLDNDRKQIEKENSDYMWSFECLASKCDKVTNRANSQTWKPIQYTMLIKVY